MKTTTTTILLMVFVLSLSLISAPQLLAAGAGKALTFDGTNDYVTAGTPDIVSGGGLTISAWIRADDFDVHDARIISKAVGVAEQDHYWMLSTFNSGGIKLRFRLKTSSGGTKTLIASSGTLVAGEWTHVAAVYDGTDMILYKDGLEVGRTPKTGTIAVNNGVAAMIGNNAPTSDVRPFDGLIEEVRILNVGLSTEQVREEMHKTKIGTESELVAYWQLNEGVGSVSADNSGNGHNGSLFNGTDWSNSTAPVGDGTAHSAIVGSTGNVDFTGANLSINFQSHTGSDHIVTTCIANGPEGTQPTGVNSTHEEYWVVGQFGTGSFIASMTFAGLSISPADQLSPSNLKLFRREFNADGPWVEIASGSSATSSSVTFDGISTSGQFAIGTIGDSPLPIQLSSFAAFVVNGNDVRLDWTTISELNNYGFYVERRTESEAEFIEVANSFVPGNGTTIEPHEYSFTDVAVAEGTYFYRLRQVDLDGEIHQTDAIQISVGTVASVSNKLPASFALSQNYPNPFNPSTNITFSVQSSGRTILKVYNLIGQEIATLFDEFAEAGREYHVTFEALHLANGTYLYKLSNGDNVAIHKMTLLK